MRPSRCCAASPAGAQARDRGTRAGSAYGVHLRLPRRRRPAPRDQRRAPGRGELELRQPRPVLRQGRRPDRLRQGVPGGLDARPAPAPVRFGALNTLLLQGILSEEKWQKRLTDADRRALSPLFWTHVNPYGRFELDMNSHLALAAAASMVPGRRTPPETGTARSAAGGSARSAT
ncbi:Tn3 family transposase [Streptomyces sp. QHH-9511]|nr:Tn3 family transposase [Streptomyces sp. QHH-9511]